MHERKYPLQNRTKNGIVVFNRIKFWDAIKYVAKLHKITLVKLLDQLKLKTFYNNYLVSGTQTPKLETLITVCDKLSLNPISFVFNSSNFNPKKDYIGKTSLKFRSLSESLIEDLAVITRRVFRTLIQDLPDIDFVLVQKKNYAVIYADYKNANHTVYLHFVLQDHKLYALHDKGLKNLENLNKEYSKGFSSFNESLYNTYKNLFIIEQLNTYTI